MFAFPGSHKSKITAEQGLHTALQAHCLPS